MRADRAALIVMPLTIAAAALWLMWPAPPQPAAPGSIPHADPAAIALGQRLYGDHCASCHGADLAGQPDWRVPDADGYLPAPPHDASGHTWHHPDDQLFAITKFGTAAQVGGDYRSRMEGFGDRLGDAEIRAVLAYIKSTWPPAIIARHDRLSASP